MDEQRVPDPGAGIESKDTPTQDLPGRRRSIDARWPDQLPNDGDLEAGDPPTEAFEDEPVKDEPVLDRPA